MATAEVSGGARDRFLRALVLFGAVLVVVTESLGALSLIRRGPLIVCWSATLAAALLWRVRRHAGSRARRSLPHADPVVLVCVAGVFAVLSLTGLAAVASPPNSADAMAYHMPRVVYWAEQSSVRFFPTPYFNQIMLQPAAEYAMLHAYVLSGGDRWINMVQWFASLASVIGVSAVAGLFGAGGRGQAMAALFAATLPSGILASSGAKNDYWMAMWLLTAVYFALRFTRTLMFGDALLLGVAFGLALLTKATAYLFAPWPLAAILALGAGKSRRRLAAGAGMAIAAALALNAPLYLRNYALSGSPLGFDSAQGDGVYRWRNETFGWKQTASNILRNASEQLGARGDGWNRGVYSFVVRAHGVMAMDVNAPGTTFRGGAFKPPRNANHEADAPNRWHLAILLAIAAILAARATRGRDRQRALYAISLVCAFVGFCAYLKWQPFLARLFLPLFILGAPLAGLAGGMGGRLPLMAQLAACLFLLGNARLPLTHNWVRPLTGVKSVLRAPRADQYFADMSQWGNRASYREAAAILAASNCRTVGIDITNLQLEYPLQALLRERQPEARFVHAGVDNVSAGYRQPVQQPPCAIVCLDCARDASRLRCYSDFGPSRRAGEFVIFLRPPP